ncbi:MAG: glycosyltransferase family 2 protein [Sporomusaceae bacterium]|nr:glycosyltransferase family 2 protein [Sporomusaceae bacterium]
MAYFTIIIPVFNREKEVVRAIESCLKQSFDDFEVLVVDDASTDQSADVAGAILDYRIRLIRHRQNQGVCPARNTGIDYSQGEWLLFLDSDDELLPDALLKIRQETLRCPETIERLGFLYRRDDGRVSPEPVFGATVLNYESFLRWRDSVGLSDFFHCVRRRSLEKVRFSRGRAYEETYLLDFAQTYQTRMIPEVVALVHLTSANRASNVSVWQRSEGFLRDAPDQVQDTTYILSRHGPALKRYAPKWYRIFRQGALFYSFLARNRFLGFKLALAYLQEYPWQKNGWLIAFAGLVSPRLLALMRAWETQRREVL